MDVNNVAEKVLDWRFLNEPWWRWFMFILLMGFLLGSWKGVMRHME